MFKKYRVIQNGNPVLTTNNFKKAQDRAMDCLRIGDDGFVQNFMDVAKDYFHMTGWAPDTDEYRILRKARTRGEINRMKKNFTKPVKLIVDSMDEVWSAYKKAGIDPEFIEIIKSNHKESHIVRTEDGKIIWWL